MIGIYTSVGYWRAAPVQSILAATAASILDPIRILVARLRRATMPPPPAGEGAPPEAPPEGPAGGAPGGPRWRRFFTRFGFTRA